MDYCESGATCVIIVILNFKAPEVRRGFIEREKRHSVMSEWQIDFQTSLNMVSYPLS